MSHWFGLTAGDVDAMPVGEIEEYVSRLQGFPPIGSTFLVEKKKGR